MMDPIAIAVGPITIRWYGVIMATAFLLGIYLAYQRAWRNQINPDHILNMAIFIVPASLIGARLYFVAFSWPAYADNPISALAIWEGGLAIHGGLLGGLLAGLIYVWRHGLPVGQIADIMAPSLILGQAIGRWGNFFNQEAHGGPVTEQFFQHFPAFIKNQMFIQGTYYHPTFLYESVWNFFVFGILMWRWPRKQNQGEIALLYLILYSIGRFAIESLRTDSLMLGPLRIAQVMSVILIIIGCLGLFWLSQRQKKW